MIERKTTMCMLDPRLDCPSECKLYSTMAEAIGEYAAQKGVASADVIDLVRDRFAVMSVTGQAKLITDHMQGVSEDDGDANDCLGFKNREPST